MAFSLIDAVDVKFCSCERIHFAQKVDEAFLRMCFIKSDNLALLTLSSFDFPAVCIFAASVDIDQSRLLDNMTRNSLQNRLASSSSTNSFCVGYFEFRQIVIDLENIRVIPRSHKNKSIKYKGLDTITKQVFIKYSYSSRYLLAELLRFIAEEIN